MKRITLVLLVSTFFSLNAQSQITKGYWILFDS